MLVESGGDVVYHWETSRAADCLKKVIAADFNGTLQCDAYVAYGSFVKNHARQVTLAGCWARARRNFYEAREQAPQRCGWILRQIGHLYRIEENLRRSRAGPRKRAAERMSQSRPICERLHRALVLFKKSRRYLPRIAFGQALDYALSRQTAKIMWNTMMAAAGRVRIPLRKTGNLSQFRK
jgi:transposase